MGFDGMQKARIQPNVITFSAAISACEKGAQWPRVLSLFLGMQKARIQPDVITYNAAISACEKGAQWPRALSLFDRMQKARIQPDVITYSAAIHACGSAGEWQRSSELFEKIMRDFKLLPYAGTLTPLVMAFTAAGKFAEARTVCDEIADEDDPQYEYFRKRPSFYREAYPIFKALQTAFIVAGMEADAWKVQDAMDRFKLEPLRARVTANVYGTQREYENGAEENLEQPLKVLFDLV